MRMPARPEDPSPGAGIAHIEWILVGSELEALILEMNLIKKHRPKYNIRLKDDKRYPYIKIHWNEPYPKVTVTRLMQDDGARYFGPYTSAWASTRPWMCCGGFSHTDLRPEHYGTG